MTTKTILQTKLTSHPLLRRGLGRLLLTTLSLLVLSGLFAQQPQNRTNATIVADALAQLPTRNPKQHSETFSSLISSGEEGLLSLIQMLQVPDVEGNEAVEFAINGWTHFVANDTPQREMAAATFAKALNLPLDKETKAFLIRQLELIGNDNQIPALSPFIDDDALSASAVQALTAINSEKSNETLLNALKNTKTESVKISLVNAVGKTKYAPAETTLLDLLQNNPSEALSEVLPNNIYRTGTTISLPVLKAWAEKAEYSYQKDNATTAYINLLAKLATAYPNEIRKEADALLAKATRLDKQDLRIAAVEIQMNLPAVDKTKILKSALKDDNKLFLTNALYFYSPYKDRKGVASIVKRLQKTDQPDIQSTLIYWLGNERLTEGIPAIAAHLDNANRSVQIAAIQSLTNIGTDDALQPLMQVFATNDSVLISRTKDELLSVNNKGLSQMLAAAFQPSSAAGKIAMLEIIGSKQMSEQYPIVYAQMNATDKNIKAQAAKSLKSVVTSDNLPDLFNLLERTDEDYIAPLQEAVNAALSEFAPEEQTVRIIRQMDASSKKHLYYNILANNGTQTAKQRILNDYKNGRGAVRTAAFEALTRWKSFDAVYDILDIARNSDKQAEWGAAADALIALIGQYGRNGEVKTLYLRETMPFAQNDGQRNAILQLLGGTNSYKALLYAAPYIEQTALRESAAQAVMNIALNNPAYLDNTTAQLLNKAGEALNNPDADYQREAIKSFLDKNLIAESFTPLFNGDDLTGWKGLVGNPLTRAKMSKNELEQKQKQADEAMRQNWVVENGELLFTGKGDNLCTKQQYGDFEMWVDWKLYPGEEPDAGIYLRGTPQVQIWDTARVSVGAQVGSGGLYNNKTHLSTPLTVADEKVGEWNTFRIKMIGDRVTVYLNGELVTDHVILENYWDRNQTIPAIEQIELQAHGSKVAYRDIYIREIPRPKPFELSKEEVKEGFKILFDGTNMHQWVGNTNDYVSEDGNIVMYPNRGFGGNLYTKDEYDDFVFRFEFMLTPGANNGLGIRTPMEGDPAYVGMELQILDNDAPVYKNLQEYQYHGSVYGVIPAKQGFLKPLGEWNYQEVIANGNQITITLNGEVILDGNIREASENGTADGKAHPGLLNKKGHVGFLGHGSVVKFRNIRIKEL